MKKLITLSILIIPLTSACEQTTSDTENINNNVVIDPLLSWVEGPTKTAIKQIRSAVMYSWH